MIYTKRMTAKVDHDFVVFLIGMRINKPWKINHWLPVALSMPKMISELYQNPELGLISHEQWVGRTTIMIQYWESLDKLVDYSKDRSSSHLPAWSEFNTKAANNGSVGIWHETYLQGKGRYESVYNNMPQFGLAKVGEHIEAKGSHESATSRINA